MITYKEHAMSAISKAISEVYFNIPREVLDLGFNDNPAYPLLSIDEVMMSRVIRPRVLVDCNIVGGIEVYIPIERCSLTDFSNSYSYEYLIDVPKLLTNNNSIISVLGIFSGSLNNHSNAGSLTPMLGQLSNQMNVAAAPMPISTSRLELVGENKVLVTDPSVSLGMGSMKCVVSNNENLSNISVRSHLYFSKLVVLGVKAYIHNHLIVKLGKGYIQNGHELGVISDIIAEYSSANEDYNVFLMDIWSKVAFHNDTNRITNHIAGML